MNSFRIFVFTLWLLPFVMDVQAQQYIIDSLEAELLVAEEDTLKVDILNELAQEYLNVMRHAISKQYSSEALSLSERLDYLWGQFFAIHNLSRYYLTTGEYETALDISLKSKKIAQKTQSEFLIAKHYHLKGLIHLEKGEFEVAISNYKQAVEMQARIGDTLGQATSCQNLATTFQALRDFGQARLYYEKAETLFTSLKHPSHDELLGCYYNLGNLNMKEGNVEKALDYLFRSLELLDQDNPSIYLAGIYGSIGSAFRRRGNHAESVHYLQKAIDIHEIMGDKEGLAMTSGVLAITHYHMKDLDGAEKAMEKAVVIFKELRKVDNLVSAYRTLSQIKAEKGNLEEAISYLELAKEIAEEHDYTYLLATVYEGMGTLNRMRGESSEAQKWLAKSVEIFKDLKEQLRLSVVYYNIGSIYFENQQYDQALTYAQLSIDAFESRFVLVSGETAKKYFISYGKHSYHLAIISSIELEKYQEAFLYSELARGRILNVLLSDSEVQVQLPPQFELERKDILTQMQELSNLMQTDFSQDSLAILEKQKLLLQTRLEVFDAKVKDNFPEFIELNKVPLSNPDNIQKTISIDEVIIEFYFRFGQASAIVMTNTHLQIIPLPDFATIDSILQSFQKQYLQQTQQSLTETPSLQQQTQQAFFDCSSQLYQHLFEPLEATGLLKGKNLIIVPDGPLHYLPFELLIRDKEKKPFDQYSYLVQAYEISYYPSATTMAFQRSKEQEPTIYPKQLLAFGAPVFRGPGRGERPRLDTVDFRSGLAPLPHSSREVKGIAALFPKEQADVFMGHQATEDNLKALALKDYRYIHFSTHGLINTQFPKWSAIALTQDNDSTEDGLMQMYELFDLELNAELVSLSACESGLGKLVEGEGMVGFTRGLMYAGAPSLILSLWPVVDESTADLFLDYYRRLQKSDGKNKYRPLRKTQLKMIRQGGTFANPYYWAPFIFIGEK
ncbi:MAG: CHAT domain-containing protein [Bacteroidota bacterium]